MYIVSILKWKSWYLECDSEEDFDGCFNLVLKSRHCNELNP